MSTQFRVDVAQLGELGESLRRFHSEFANSESVMRSYEDDVGHPEVAEKLRSFATNWSDKRRKVQKLLEDVARYAEQAYEAYCGVEQELSSQYCEAGAAGSAGGAAGGAGAAPQG
ncbi:MAG: hypothetical protein M3134_03085, partial [Actinomycetota bacterium]|nr:hypothetical protein [Actinomycetota bacterium]